MRKFLFAAAVAAAVPLCVPIDAQAFGRRSKSTATRVTTTKTSSVTTATEKSTYQARRGVMGHVGRLLPGLREGVGFSTRSAQEALDSCCYSRSGMAVVDQAVVAGRGGWYATKLYQATEAIVTAPVRVMKACVNGVCPTK